MTFKSSNTEWVESLPTNRLIQDIRIAMGEGCIKPAHVYDLVDEALQRLSEANDTTVSKPSGSTCTCELKCPRCKTEKKGCEFLNPLDGETCHGVVYPTYPPKYDKCVFAKD